MFKVYYDGGYVFVAKEEMDEFLKWATENGVSFKITDAETGEEVIQCVCGTKI